MRVIRVALPLLVAAALTLGTTSCSTDITDRFRPNPPDDHPGNVQMVGTADQDESGDVSPPRALRPDRGNGRGAREFSVPQELQLAGTSVTLTPSGSELGFGNTATITTADWEGRLLGWNITVNEPEPRAPQEVVLVDSVAAQDMSGYLCFTYDVEYLGAETGHVDGRSVLAGVPSPDVSVSAPEITPLDDNREPSSMVIGGVEGSCGVSDTEHLPPAARDLEIGRHYTRAALAVVRADEQPARAVRFDYREALRGTAGHEGPRRPKPVYWD